MITLSEKTANRVYNVLVEHAGASNDDQAREHFIQRLCHIGSTEYRFGGALGLGGKIKNKHGQLYVLCYPEDETEERLEMIRKTNRILSDMVGGANGVS